MTALGWFMIPQHFWFLFSLCGAAGDELLRCSHAEVTATHKGALILTLPYCSQTIIMRLGSQYFKDYRGIAVISPKHREDIQSCDNKPEKHQRFV